MPVAGTPERPLSDLGMRTYVAYWVNVIVRYLRQQFTTLSSSETPSSSALNDGQIGNIQEEDRAKTLLKLSLLDIANACHFRVDDVAVALERCGLAQYRKTVKSEDEEGGVQDAVEVLITPEHLESVAESWKVKPAFLKEECLLL